jgi:hypothetical protein
LYNFILVFFGLNKLSVMPVIFNYLFNLLSMPTSFHKISNILSS